MMRSKMGRSQKDLNFSKIRIPIQIISILTKIAMQNLLSIVLPASLYARYAFIHYNMYTKFHMIHPRTWTASRCNPRTDSWPKSLIYQIYRPTPGWFKVVVLFPSTKPCILHHVSIVWVLVWVWVLLLTVVDASINLNFIDQQRDEGLPLRSAEQGHEARSFFVSALRVEVEVLTSSQIGSICE